MSAKKASKNYQIKSVCYLDSNMSWEQQETTIRPVEVFATGVVVDETEEFITLALEIVHTEYGDEFRNQVCIPKIAIIG